jgi:hypothetical protein
MYIYRLTNTETGAVLEGTAAEMAEEMGINLSSLRQACARGQRVRHIWGVECLGEAYLLPEHAKRLGMIKPCAVCGKPFAAKRQKDCCCSKECTRINENRRRQEWWKEQSEINRSTKNPKRRKKKGLTAAEINKRARAEHLTYGQYVAKYGL